jgi:hypothetical protein
MGEVEERVVVSSRLRLIAWEVHAMAYCADGLVFDFGSRIVHRRGSVSVVFAWLWV